MLVDALEQIIVFANQSNVELYKGSFEVLKLHDRYTFEQTLLLAETSLAPVCFPIEIGINLPETIKNFIFPSNKTCVNHCIFLTIEHVELGHERENIVILRLLLNILLYNWFLCFNLHWLRH